MFICTQNFRPVRRGKLLPFESLTTCFPRRTLDGGTHQYGQLLCSFSKLVERHEPPKNWTMLGLLNFQYSNRKQAEANEKYKPKWPNMSRDQKSQLFILLAPLISFLKKSYKYKIWNTNYTLLLLVAISCYIETIMKIGSIVQFQLLLSMLIILYTYYYYLKCY